MHEYKIEELVHEFVRHEMVLSVGTGGLAYDFIKKLAVKILEERLHVSFIPSSMRQAFLLAELELPMTGLDEREVDVAFEFANRADKHKNFVKLETSSLVKDKMIAQSAEQLIVISEAQDFVKHLAGGIVPFEVARFGLKRTQAQLMNFGNTQARMGRGELLATETGNCLVDVDVHPMYSLDDIDYTTKRIPGVLETGVFMDLADEIVFFSEKLPHKTVRVK